VIEVYVDRRGWGELGRAIVELLNAAGGPMTPAQMREALGTDLAYTTVMTVMARLADRAVLVRQRAGRGYAYTTQTDRAEVTARQMHRLLDTDEDREGVLARFVDRLSADDEQLLARLLGQMNAQSEDGELR
jgi:predicted transcriptional regulator